MALDGRVVAGKCDVTECLGLEKVVQHRQQVVAVVVPPETEHLGQGIHLGDRELWQQTERKKKKDIKFNP